MKSSAMTDVMIIMVWMLAVSMVGILLAEMLQ